MYAKRIVSLLLATLGLIFAIHLHAAQSELKVYDVAERSFDNAPAIAVVLSAPLDPHQRYDEFLSVSKTGGATVSGGWVLADNRRTLYFANIEPQARYTVLVRRGLPAADGAALQSAAEFFVTTRAVKPMYGFASRGSVLPARLSDGLPVLTINVPDVDIEFMRVKDDNLPQFFNMLARDNTPDSWQMDRLHPMVESVYLQRFVTEGKPNARTITNVPVEEIKELRRPGLYIAVMRQPGRFGYYNNSRISYFFVSDIGLHVRAYPGSMEIYASSLALGRALPDVEIEAFDDSSKSQGKVFTDATGFAKLPNRPRNGLMLVARKGDHLSLLSFSEPALDLSEFDITGRPQLASEAFVYGDRDLYRPGETAQISVLLRNQDGRMANVQPPLHVLLKRPDGEEAGKFVWQPQSRGYYQQALAIAADAQTGVWNLEVRADPAARQPTAVYSYHVEDFLPERMKLEMSSESDYLKPQQTFEVALNGAYLYGAPAAGNRVSAVLNVRRDNNPLATALPGFVFGDVNEDERARREELEDLTLDAEGKGTLELNPFTDRPNSPMQVRLTASLYESGGRPVTRSFSRTYWPAEAMVGIRPAYSGEHADANSTVKFEVVRADPSGKLLAAKSLDVKVIREDRDYYWEFDEGGGWHYNYSESAYPIMTQSLSFAAGSKGQLAVPVEWGRYRIEITDTETRLTARYRFYAGWNWRDDSKNTARPDSVVLKLDKAAYRGGDTAKLTIIPPHTGETLVTVEGDGRLWSGRYTVQASGGAVSIPIAKEWARHDLYVTAVTFRPATAKEKITPNRAMGVVHLPLDRTERKLEVKVEAPAKMQPENSLKVKLKLPELKGQSAMATVAAVDVGILNITNYKSPDPWSYFFGKRRYSVDSYDLYGKVIENMKGSKARLRFGGDADTGGLRKDKRAQAEVKIVALFTGPVQINANGEAEVKLDVPDFNGTLRVMAVAWSDDRFGSAESEVVVAAPIVAEIATPRFLGAGDKSRLTVDLQNVSGGRQEATLKITATSPLQLAPVEKKIALDDKQKQTLTFDLAAEQDFGVGAIELSVSGKGVNIKRHFELGVRPPWPGERRVQYRTLQPGEALTLDVKSSEGLMEKTVEAVLFASNMPPLNMKSAVKGLLEYPYGCLEQTTSSAYPNLFIDEAQAKALGLAPVSLAERAKRTETAIQRLMGMQLASGGFSLWGKDGPEEMWLTPYVTAYLLDAREQGFAVPDAMLNRALANLTTRLLSGGAVMARDSYSDSPAHLNFAANAYAAYVLARERKAPLGTLRTLYDHEAAKAESGLPLVQLGLALKLQGDERRGMEAITAGVKKPRAEKWYLGDYGSDLRDYALMYALLVRHNVSVEGRDELLFLVAKELGNRPYLSTQERFAIYLAGQHSAKAQGKPWRASVKSASGEEKIESKGREVRSFGQADLQKGLSLTSQADSALYTEAEVTGYPKSAPPPAQDALMAISRSLHTPDGKLLGDRPLKVGELLIVHLNVASRKHVEDGMVVDLLPAGLEIENLNISQGESLADLKIDNVTVGKSMENEGIKHQEYRDDRYVAAVRLNGYNATHLFYLVRVVSPGSYVVPAPFVEDMYRPNLRAIGVAPGVMKIEAK